MTGAERAEADRLDALRRHGILDTPAEPAFDAVVEGVRRLCAVPIALVSLIDADRQWFKARAGLALTETPRGHSVCDLTIRDTTMLEIADLSRDPRTAGSPLVAGADGLRFYAGVPLITRDGHALGSLCAIDMAPRPEGLTDAQRIGLEVLAGQVVALIEMRDAVAAREAALAVARRVSDAADTEIRYHAIVESVTDHAIVSFDEAGLVTSWNSGAERMMGWTAAEMIGRDAATFFTPEDRAAGVVEREFATARATGRAADERWHLRRDGTRFFAEGAITPLTGTVRGGFVKALRDVTADRANRASLRASREKLELATRAARLGMFDYHPETGQLEWDDRVRELFGLRPGAPIDYEGAFLAGLHPDDRDHAAAAVSGALDPAGSRTFDTEYRTIGIEDGIERHLHAQGMSLFDGGTSLRLIGTVQDVTASRRAQNALAVAEERLRLAARATNDVIWDWDLAHDHVAWNEAIEHAYGYRPAAIEPSGAWWIEHIHPDDRARVDRSIHALIDSRDTDWTSEYRFRRADGSHADVRDRGFVIRDGDGKAIRMLGAMLDQSERKAVERRLVERASGLAQQVEQSRVEVERLWSASPDLLVLIGEGGLYYRTNPAWETLLGWPADALVGRVGTELAHPDDRAASAEAEATARVTRLTNFENRIRHRDGSYRWFSWAAAAEAGEVFAIGRDITDEVAARETLRQTEEALRQSQKVEAVGQLTGGVAHDFNNLLTVIRGSVDLLRRPDLSPERRARYIEAIADTADRATRLTSQLLAFARRSALQPQVFDARRSVAAIESMLQTLIGSRIDIRAPAPGAACWVDTDPSQFDTAIVNMAVNARDAMDGEGTLAIDVRAIDRLPAIRGHDPVAAPYVAVSIADSGSGIAPDKIEHIFEPFFTTKGVGHGTGLGLSQVFGFAKQSGGEVTVESRVGEGSTFTLYLPMAEPRAEAAAPVIARRPLRTGACVLVVEDNAEVGTFATQALAELGYRSRWARDAAAALAMLDEAPGGDAATDGVDVIFTDVVMPGMSGIELAEEVRRRRPHLPVVLTSGYSHILAEQGAQGFPLLHKPYSIDELARALDNVTAD